MSEENGLAGKTGGSISFAGGVSPRRFLKGFSNLENHATSLVNHARHECAEIGVVMLETLPATKRVWPLGRSDGQQSMNVGHAHDPTVHWQVLQVMFGVLGHKAVQPKHVHVQLHVHESQLAHEQTKWV